MEITRLEDKRPRGKRLSFPWMLALALATGVISGAFVAAFYFIVIVVIWQRALSGAFFPGGMVALPVIALLLGGLMLAYFVKSDVNPPVESVLESYHGRKKLDLALAPGKLASSAISIGLGGSGGLVGPLFYGGGAIALWLYGLFGFDNKDEEAKKVVLMSGAAAGFSAALLAPVSAAIFAFELPYRRGVSARNIAPALVASIASYAVMAIFYGRGPFLPASIARFTFVDLISAAFIGALCGAGARIFMMFYATVHRGFDVSRAWLPSKMLLGGAITGAVAYFAFLMTGTPFVLGYGREPIAATLALAYNPIVYLGLLMLKIGATAATLGSGAFGGTITPMILMGALLGAAWGRAIPFGTAALMPVIGMGGFFAAGYNAPVTAAVLVVELSGSPAALIPALVTAVVAWLVSGLGSVVTLVHSPS